MASRILVVCIFCVTQLCNFTVYFTVKYVNSLAHTHYYPCNRYQAFIFRTSVRPFHCVYEKLGLGTRLCNTELGSTYISSDALISHSNFLQ